MSSLLIILLITFGYILSNAKKMVCMSSLFDLKSIVEIYFKNPLSLFAFAMVGNIFIYEIFFE